MKQISGILEHILFIFMKKGISYDIQGRDREEKIYIYFDKEKAIMIQKNKERVSYYFSRSKQSKYETVSKENLLKMIKEEVE